MNGLAVHKLLLQIMEILQIERSEAWKVYWAARREGYEFR
jgi:hypothetical protein